jgi:hypothetical protein
MLESPHGSALGDLTTGAEDESLGGIPGLPYALPSGPEHVGNSPVGHNVDWRDVAGNNDSVSHHVLGVFQVLHVIYGEVTYTGLDAVLP